MAVVYVPIRTVSLQTASNPGNIYWKKLNLTAWETQVPALKTNVDSTLYGQVYVPANLSPINTTKNIYVNFTTPATGGVIRVTLAWSVISAGGGDFNPTSFTAETAQDFTIVPPARVRFTNQWLNIGATFYGHDMLALAFTRNGAHANDTCADDMEIHDWGLEVEI